MHGTDFSEKFLCTPYISRKNQQETCKKSKDVYAPTHKMPKRNRKIYFYHCLQLLLWKFMGIFFVAASRFTTREINTMLKLSSINISLKMNINWWVNSSLDFLFHLFALLFIACYTLIHSDISLNANWHSKRFTDRPFHRSTQWNTALIFLPPFGSNNQLPFES